MKTKPIKTPPNWKELSHHPLSKLVPFGAGLDTDEMADFLKKHGYDEAEPIILFEGMILDHRHLHAACKKAGVIPKFAEFVGVNAAAYVSKKLFRQYPTIGERAKLAATYANIPWGAHAAEEEMSNDSSSKNPDEPPSMTVRQAAKAFGVSEASVARAKAKLKNLCPACTTKQRKSQPLPEKCEECKKQNAGRSKGGKGGKKRSNNGAVIPTLKNFKEYGGRMSACLDEMAVQFNLVKSFKRVGDASAPAIETPEMRVIRSKIEDVVNETEKWHEKMVRFCLPKEKDNEDRA